MSKKKLWIALAIVLVWGAVLAPVAAQAAPPVVKTVPWVATNPLIPHDTWIGKTVTLKGTCDQQGANIRYTWDFGDGTPVATGTVSNMYVIEATHAYTGAAGTVFTARLTVQNLSTGETGNKAYYVAIQDKTLEVEVNVAIDQGLWYLHKTMTRSGNTGRWTSGSAGSGWVSNDAANVNAFEVNGHLESGDPSNPYVDTVARGMRWIISQLSAFAIPATQTNPLGTFTCDSNVNGLGVWRNSGQAWYEGGMFMDAIVASGTPNAVATTGSLSGRTYKDIVQDMVDAYAWAQYDPDTGGGWRYSANQYPDNSVCQWAAIGMIAAEKNFGCTVPALMKEWNKRWLKASQYKANDYYKGAFGYQPGYWFPWGPYATTPSGMVQMCMDGEGRGLGDPNCSDWDLAETFIRDKFANTGDGTNNIKNYYYGLFSFVKSMLLHNTNGVPGSAPITMLQSQTPGVPPLDWYAAEVSKGAPTDGVARTLVNGQTTAGYWFGHDVEGTQQYFETAWAIMMLHKTLFEAGKLVAVAKAIPNPAVAGQIITLDGSDSYHQDASKSIDSWEWDLDNDGVYDKTGPVVTASFSAVGDYVVKLRVTDTGTPEASATTTVTVRVTTPPIAPTADAGGPYTFCLDGSPMFLDASLTINPDEGQHQPGSYPGDTINGNANQFAWDLDGDVQYDDAIGKTPDVTAFFTAMGPGDYLVSLKVTDTTAASYPSSGQPNLSSIATAQVRVRAATDPVCVNCVKTLTARAKLTKIQLVWPAQAGAAYYNVYRGTISGGPYVKIGSTTSTYSTYLDNGPLVVGTTYYYVVRPVLPNTNEICESNEASATPSNRR